MRAGDGTPSWPGDHHCLLSSITRTGALLKDADSIRASIQREFSHLEETVFAAHHDVFTVDSFSFEKYSWSKELVLSRAYAIDELGGLVCDFFSIHYS